MKHTITLLLAGLCAVALAETKSDPIAIFVGGAKVSDSVLAEMRREVEATTERTGILISWHDLHAPRETSSYADIVVIRLVGDCNEVADRASTDRGPKTLGSTHTTDGRILPFGDVFCEPVRQLIRPSLVGATRQARGRILGRALGRVLSHELYHILGHTTVHGATGLAKATHSYEDLITGAFRFDERAEQTMSEGPADSGR